MTESDPIVCHDCQYPFNNKNELSSQIEKHKLDTINQENNIKCSICNEDVMSGDIFRKHINKKHLSEFNCTECDFQASSQIILSKHTNLKHRQENEHSKDTYKCKHCTEQFSAIWNLNCHVGDKHGVKEPCKYFKQGRCSFPDNICWKKHEVTQSVMTTEKNFKCRRVLYL